MPDEKNTTQNQISEENPAPISPQTTSESAVVDTSPSEALSMPPEAPEAPADVSTLEVVNNTTPETTENKAEMVENGQNTENIPLESTDLPVNRYSNGTSPENQDSSSGEAGSEATPVLVEATEPGTAQTPVNEPLENESKTSNEQAKPVRENSKSSLARQLLISARNAIQFRKRKKLDRIMTLFLEKSKITNDDVEKFLHVSDATASRYLSQLEKEGKIKQNGRTGAGVSYSRI